MIKFIIIFESNKFYIGTVNDIYKLLYGDIIDNKQFSWLKKYKPINIIDIIKSNFVFDVDIIVEKYMNIYGINNVRGGKYNKLILSTNQIKQLEKKILPTNNICFKCNKSGHYSDKCNNDNKDIWFITCHKIDKKNILYCFKCGSLNHYTYNCTGVVNIKNIYFRCFKCGDSGHYANECNKE